MVELALILPVMLVLFASALDLGRMFYSQITIANAAKEGAFEASRNPASFDNTQPCNVTTNRVICLVINEAKGSFYSITPADVTLVCSPDPCPSDPAVGDTVTVKVTGKFTLITPLLASFVGGQTINLSASALAYLGVQPEPAAGASASVDPSASASVDPSASASVDPSASASTGPGCVTPAVTNDISVSPTSGHPSNGVGIPGTLFTLVAPAVTPQAGCTFSYTWSFGDGASGTGATAMHSYDTKGNAGSGSSKYFTVTLAISTSGVAQTWTGNINVPVN